MSGAPLSRTSSLDNALRALVSNVTQVEAQAAAAAATERSAPASSPQAIDPAKALLDTARAQAAARQGGLAPLFANLTQARALAGLPAEVRVAIQQLLAFPTPAAGDWSAQTVRQVFLRSGLFHEVRLAEAAPTPDLKAALLILKQALGENIATQPRLPPRPAKAPPPTRDAALAGQPAVDAEITTETDHQPALQILGRDVEQALARQVLHQMASLPEGPKSAWMFEFPLVTPQGVAIAQFEIEQDHGGSQSAEATRPWRARVSLDVDPLGPVHAELLLKDGVASATIWAEREAGLGQLRDHIAELAGAFPAPVTLRAGAPPVRPPTGGQFVSITS